MNQHQYHKSMTNRNHKSSGIDVGRRRNQDKSIASTFKLSLLLGFLSTIVVWALFWFLGSHYTGWSATPMGLLYNVPISFPFFVLCWDMIFSFRDVTFLEGLRSNAAYMVVWIVGLSVLYLRLVTRTVTISGHMTWLMVMPVYSYLRKLPISFTLFILLITAQAGYFNFAIFPSNRSGFCGVYFGFLLSCLLVVLNHWITKRSVGKKTH